MSSFSRSVWLLRKSPGLLSRRLLLLSGFLLALAILLGPPWTEVARVAAIVALAPVLSHQLVPEEQRARLRLIPSIAAMAALGLGNLIVLVEPFGGWHNDALAFAIVASVIVSGFAYLDVKQAIPETPQQEAAAEA
jgi:hypothetical protein